MARTCDISGKRKSRGHKVSHSNIKTLRSFNPNLQTKRILNPATGKMMKITVSTKSLRTLNKWVREGKNFDLRELIKSER